MKQRLSSGLGDPVRYPDWGYLLNPVFDAIRWILALVLGGLLVSEILVPICYHRYVVHGIGPYGGVIHGKCFAVQSGSYLEFDGESKFETKLWPPTTYTYDSLDIKLTSADGINYKGKLNVPSMTFATDEQTCQLNKELLSDLLFSSSSNDFVETGKLHDLLKSAGTGKFPSPQHHSTEIGSEDSQLVGSFVHWSRGRRISHLLVYWAIAWVLALIVYVIRKFRGRAAG